MREQPKEGGGVYWTAGLLKSDRPKFKSFLHKAAKNGSACIVAPSEMGMANCTLSFSTQP